MLLSTNYFGSIPYFQALASEEKVTIDLHEFYKKQTWRNRTQILESNGPMYLSVPVERPNGSQSIVQEVQIGNETNWRKDHWKAIESSYKHAPFFFYYGPFVKQLIYQEETLLYKFNAHIFKMVLSWLDLNIETDFTTNYIPPADKTDLRVALDTKKFSQQQRPYIQVFSDKAEFVPNLSILDLLMNEGPLSRNYLLPKERNLYKSK
jgi:hypothetical protein